MLAAVDQVMAALVLVMIRLHNGPLSRADVVEVLVPAAVLSVFSTIFALALVILVDQGAVGVVVAAVLVAMSAVAYRTYTAARRQHQSLTLVHEFVTGGVGAPSLESLAQELLARLRRLLRASSVEVSIHEPDGARTPGGRLRPHPVRQRARLPRGRPPRLRPRRRVLEQVLTRGEPFLAPRTTKDQREQAGCADTATATPWSSPCPRPVACRAPSWSPTAGETATFTPEDLTLVQTLTGHLAVALRSARLVQKLGHEATHDALTGLSNRRGLSSEGQARLDREPARSRALLLLDLDKFKEVNDSLGHAAGDQLLVEIGARLQSELRGSDLLARLGGDEFRVLLEDAGADEAAAVARNLLVRLPSRSPRGRPVGARQPHAAHHREHRHRVLPRDGPDLPGLLRKADIAMYKAKVSGGGYHVYDDVDHDDGAARLRTMDELQSAITESQFVLHYQPKVDLATGAVHAVEALTRWEHPTRGLLYPDAFIELVEDAGLMRAMTRVVLDLAIDQAARWPRTATGSASPSTSRPARSSTRACRTRSSRCSRSAPCRRRRSSSRSPRTSSWPTATGRARSSRACARAGSGSRSTTTARATARSPTCANLPVDELKLDRSFVMSMTDDEHAAALVASTIALAHSLGLRMVAEGVETHATYSELARLGCDEAQGYFISRPVPAGAFEQWLHHQPRTRESARALEYRRFVAVAS